LTYEQLMARRPVITIASKAKKGKYDTSTVDFEATAPAGVEIESVKAFDGDKPLPIENGKIKLGYKEKKGKKKIKVTAVSDELLCSTIEKDVIIDD